MRQIYNTSDNIYVPNDVLYAFQHAYNLGSSNWDGDIKKAFKEWEKEYKENTKKELTFNILADCISVYLGTNKEAITNQDFRKTEKVVRGRMFLCWFAYMYLDTSVDELSELMDYKNHASILYGAYRVNDELEMYPHTRSSVNMIKHLIKDQGCVLEYKRRERASYDEPTIV